MKIYDKNILVESILSIQHPIGRIANLVTSFEKLPKVSLSRVMTCVTIQMEYQQLDITKKFSVVQYKVNDRK